MIVDRRPLLVAALLLMAALDRADGQTPAAPKAPSIPDTAEKDYGAELPRFPMKEPEESLRAIVPRPGFRVDLVAAEPLLRSPVAIDFDEDGRLYVAEFPEYNQDAKPGQKHVGTGCVRLLEDTRGVGVYDNSTLFAADVPMATAVACWDGGIYVGSAPDLLYLKDTDGDGKADVRRVVYTGFGTDRAGEGMLNSFRWGLDNRFHITTSLDGGSVRRGDHAGARTVSVRGHVFLLDPRGDRSELTGGGGQHGMSMDDWSRHYVCGNSEPFSLVMYDSRYLARNPYLQAPAAAVNVAPAGKFTKLHRISAVEPWRILRTRLRSQGIVPGSDEGGSPSGFFTGATGVTVYRGDAFPREFAGNLFVGEVANNLIHRAIAEPAGVLVTARSAEPGREFLASRDSFFRPVQMANAPDGCLWVVDMYRELIEGAAFLAPQILKHMDVASGVDRGRIWRIAPEDYQPRIPRLGKARTAELVGLLDHPNGWHRDTASRLLYQRQDRSAIDPLRRLAAGSKQPIGRAHALWTLAGLGAIDAEDVQKALVDADPRVRVQALRLAEPFCREVESIRTRIAQMVADPDPKVRYQLAYSLGVLPGPQATPALAALAIRDGSDPWMRVAILSSATGCTGSLFEGLAGDAGFRSSKPGRTLLTDLVGQTGATERPDDLAAILRTLDGPLAGDEMLSRDIVLALMGADSPAVRARLSGEGGGRLRSIRDAVLADARTTADDDRKPVAARTIAIRALRFASLSDAQGLLTGLLAARQPMAVQAEAIETLARFDDAAVPEILIRGWREMTPRLHATAAEALFSRASWVGAFLDAVEKGTIGRADVEPARLELLRSYPDAAIRARAARVFAASQTRRQDVIAAYQKALQLKGDPGRGKEIFKAQCSSCHRLEGVGQQVGAELSAIRDRGLEAVLLNILDPNREVMPQFLSYVLVTTNGRVLTGMIAVETTNSLTIRQPDGHEETVLRLQIEELRSTGLSYMPEGLEKQIDVPAMADLLAYLNSVK
jgi:putative membrane-bound dehydrogenase-like protein